MKIVWFNDNPDMAGYWVDENGEAHFREGESVVKGMAFCECEQLEIARIPEGITEIHLSAFEECRNLRVLVLPSSLKKIDTCAFYGCESLTTVVIPDGTEDIESDAFKNCKNLGLAVIPESAVIGNQAFKGCENCSVVINANSMNVALAKIPSAFAGLTFELETGENGGVVVSHIQSKSPYEENT